MRAPRSTASTMVALVLLLGGASLATGGSATAAPAPSAVPAAARAASAATSVRAAKPRHPVFTPRAGVTINNPIGNKAARLANLSKIENSVRSAPKGSNITIASWNIRSGSAVAALVAAHRRGVRVRVIMDRGNGNAHNNNPSFNRLHRALRVGNAKLPSSRRSWARECVSSCRGKYGISHTKMYLFSRAGKATDVLMYGSANLTDLAASAQWNDIYTIVNRPVLYNAAMKIFVQMTADRPVAQGWVQTVSRTIDLGFFPWTGKGATGDPVMNMLDQVHCRGANGGTGNNGRTAIRIAQTAINGTRGLALSTKLHQLWDQGCDIKVIYAVMGKQSLKAFRTDGPRGPIPFRQVVQDFNGDFVYDRYLHTKVLALSGVYGNDHHAEISWNGSSNWTAVSLASDDTFARISNKALRLKYAKFVNYWYYHPPTSATPVGDGGISDGRRIAGTSSAAAVPAGVDRDAKIQIN